MQTFASLKYPGATRVQETVAGTVTTTYVGSARPGTAESAAGWQIQLIVSDSATGTTSVTFPNGKNTFSFVWSNRETYSYS